jgi:hypothetical protein
MKPVVHATASIAIGITSPVARPRRDIPIHRSPKYVIRRYVWRSLVAGLDCMRVGNMEVCFLPLTGSPTTREKRSIRRNKTWREGVAKMLSHKIPITDRDFGHRETVKSRGDKGVHDIQGDQYEFQQWHEKRGGRC